jgi:hypothetical protein
MRNFPRVLRPSTGFTPYVAGDLAAVLSSAIDVLQDWHLPVRTEGRLRRAEEHLRTVAARGAIGNDPTDLIRTATSAALAVDFYHIATTLNETRDEPIAQELAVALGGTMEGDSKDTSAYEIQSQYWVGVLLAQSALRPAIPVSSGRKPDFIVTVNDLSCGVEVKRPQSVKAAARVLGDAADQLREFGTAGIVALDLSAAVGTNALILPQPGIVARDVVRHRLYNIGEQLGDYIHRYNRSDKYNKILALIAFARFWVWTSLDPPISDAGILFTITIFPRAYSGLLTRYGVQLQTMLLRGVEQVTGNPIEYTQR